MNSPAGRSPRRASLLAALAVGAQALVAPLAAQQPASPPTPVTPADSAARASAAGDTLAGGRMAPAPTPPPTPPVDQARGMDAELRVALYELTNDRYVAALSRLEWLQAAPTTLSPAGAPGALRGREDVSFMLAETYYRLGMDEAFRKTAEPLVWTSTGGKYAPLLRAQLLLEAYRRGDYAAAAKLAESMGSAATTTSMRETRLGALVTGLAAYQTRRFPDARAAFAKAQEGGSTYAPYAQYMDAITQLRSDTTQTGPALQALQSLASSATGELADQARLTAAEVAYESGDHAQAATLAGAVSSTGGLASQALLVRAWALYRSNQIPAAGEAFAEFARRFPDLPERDEARLMAAQVLLQGGRADEAGRAFRAVADSLAAESGALEGRTRTAMGQAARALVAARSAGLLFLTDPASGKTLALDERVGASDSVLATAVNEEIAATLAAGGAAVSAPHLVTFQDVRARLDSVGGTLGADFPRRVMFTPVSASANRGDYVTRASALYDADLQVAVARHRLQQQIDAQARQLALLRGLQAELANGSAILGPLTAQLTAARDSLARLTSALDAAGERIRGLFRSQISETQAIAAENAASIDSVRREMGTAMTNDDAEVLRIESSTAGTYAELARQIDAGLNGAISHHPVFAQRDSVRAHGDRIGVLLGEAQTALSTAQTLVAQDIARLEGGEGDRVTRARSTLASAESRRVAVEAQLVAVVERELNARAGTLLASLRRDTEAAEFGAASSAFFEATDTGRTAGTPGTPGGSAGVSTGAAQDVAATGGTRRADGAGAPSSSSSLPRK